MFHFSFFSGIEMGNKSCLNIKQTFELFLYILLKFVIIRTRIGQVIGFKNELFFLINLVFLKWSQVLTASAEATQNSMFNSFFFVGGELFLGLEVSFTGKEKAFKH